MCKVIASFILLPLSPLYSKGRGGWGVRGALRLVVSFRFDAHASARPTLPTKAVASYRHRRYQPMRAPHPPTPSPLETKGEGETFGLGGFEIRINM